MTAAPTAAAPAAGARPAGFLRRNRIWFAVAAALVLAVALAAWAGGSDETYSDPLDPQNSDPDGARALAQVLEDEGVEVTIARSADALDAAHPGAGTTVVVTGAEELAPSTIRRLRRDMGAASLVLVDPPAYVVDEFERGVALERADDELSGRCSEGFEGLTIAVDTAYGYATDEGCFPSGDGFVLARGPVQTSYFGAGQALTNDQVLRGDNAAVALRLLGQDDELVWYLPTYDDAAEDEAVSLWSFAPDWLVPALWLLALAVVAVALWRGRRLGRLATEPLPVVVRAVETTRSRGRMYRRADDRPYAAGALRAAARRRIADHLRLGRGATESEIITAVARHLGRPEEQVGALLAELAPVPSTDHGLVRLAQELTQLDREVRRR